MVKVILDKCIDIKFFLIFFLNGKGIAKANFNVCACLSFMFFFKKKYENIIKLNYANKCNLHAITNERTKTLAMPSKTQDHETANTQKQLKEKTKDMASL